MKKITMMFALCALLFGCSKPSVDVAVDSIKDEFYAQVDAGKLQFGAMTELDDDTLQQVYGIDPADLEDYFVALPMMNVQANEIAMFEVKDGKMDVVKEAVNARLTALEDQWKTYLPAQLELVQNAKTLESGNYYFMVISDSASETISMIEGFLK